MRINHFEDLVDPGWLAGRLGEERWRILDVTVQIMPEFVTMSGRSDWEQAHIPGQVFGDLLDGLSNRAAPTVMTMMPSAESSHASCVIRTSAMPWAYGEYLRIRGAGA